MPRIWLPITIAVGLCAAGSPVRALTDAKLHEKYGTKMSAEDVEKLLATITWQESDAKGIGDERAVKGGRIIIGSQSPPPTLRYYGMNGNTVTTHRIHQYLTHETLVDLHPATLEYAPRLADRWHIADDRLTFYFHIHPKAKFSDGHPVDAYDVVASWDLLVDEGLQDPFWNDTFRQYERPEALTRDIVRVKAKELDWRKFLSIGTSLFIFPQHVLENLDGKTYIEEYNNKLMLGTGPYQLKQSEINVKIVLERRKDWWAAGEPVNVGLANFDEVELVFIQDEQLLFEKIKKGEIDFYYCNISQRWVQEFDLDKVKKGYIVKRKVFNNKPAGIQGIGFSMRRPPFDDVRVRKAFAHCLNRKLMIEKLFFNEYEYIHSQWPGGIYENHDNPKVFYDTDKAVELLEEAGWLQDNRNEAGWLTKDGKVFELELLFVSKYSERYLTILQEDLRDVGIKLELKQVTWAEDIKQVDERNFTITNRAYAAILFPNPEQFHSKFADKKDNNNIWGLKDARVDELVGKEKIEFDIHERVKIIQEIDKIMADLHLWAFGWYAPHERLAFWNRFGMPPYILPRFELHESVMLYWWFDPAQAAALDEAVKGGGSLPVPPEEVRWWLEEYKDGE